MADVIKNCLIEKLKNLPVPIDHWILKQVGLNNEGPFKKNYQALKKKEIDEKLVDVSHFGIVAKDYFYENLKHHSIYLNAVKKGLLTPQTYLRKSHVERLVKVDDFLRKNQFFLVITSGWRHPQLQVLAKKCYRNKFGSRRADAMYAGGKNWIVPVPHSTGAAFDIEIWSRQTGKRLNTRIKYKDEPVYGHYKAEIIAEQDPDFFNSDANRKVLGNRRLLYHLLCTKGVIFNRKEDLFISHPGEVWHYGDGDPLSAYLRRDGHIRYGLIFPNKTNIN